MSVALSSSSKRNFQFDNALLNLQYHLLNDAVADPLSLAVGGSFSGAYREAVKDPTFLHFGKWEGRLYTTFGKECAPFATWISRGWGFASFGIAEKSVLFGEAFLIYERRFCNQLTLGLFSLIQGNFRPQRKEGPHWRRAWDTGLEGSMLFESSLSLTTRLFWRTFTKGTPSGPVFCLYVDMPWSL